MLLCNTLLLGEGCPKKRVQIYVRVDFIFLFLFNTTTHNPINKSCIVLKKKKKRKNKTFFFFSQNKGNVIFFLECRHQRFIIELRTWGVSRNTKSPMYLCIAPERAITIVILSPNAEHSFPFLGGISGGQACCTLILLPGVTFSLARGKQRPGAWSKQSTPSLMERLPKGFRSNLSSPEWYVGSIQQHQMQFKKENKCLFPSGKDNILVVSWPWEHQRCQMGFYWCITFPLAWIRHVSEASKVWWVVLPEKSVLVKH